MRTWPSTPSARCSTKKQDPKSLPVAPSSTSLPSTTASHSDLRELQLAVDDWRVTDYAATWW
ncbi:hypothetical protein FOL47_008094 [Perkinsus chesapeaki]|uniref:Uncharacterized protein n=1 Tax=Perkinsus chesapeaki TaxID=330153 RepID=A0A7J6LG66_PERCH|nr:hypothetical protein FOL47_008094 [Perkinsus chesapeaki]